MLNLLCEAEREKESAKKCDLAINFLIGAKIFRAKENILYLYFLNFVVGNFEILRNIFLS